ncbi:MAG: DHA2 family efflux MFS transporter permease subunit [Actinomycetota bacterium]|nr:DHA2 family efflux MFS transporter permease subunit [Actinomycetota bacterium]
MTRRNPPAEELYARKWRIWAVAMVGLFMALIDITIVNITIPTLEDELDAGVDTVSWVLNAYNIVFAVVLVSMGRLADQFGRKRFFLIGLAIFTLGSLLCGIAGSIDQLIAFRALQGLGAGVLAPLALALTTLIFPPHQRGLGLALLAVVANSAAAVGPPLGGVLLEVASWHWIFLVNVPIGVAGIVMAARVMPETYDLDAGRRIDTIGMTLLAAAVLALTYGLVEANDAGWGSPLIVGLFAASVVLAAGFGASQRYGRFPMLTAGLVRNRQFVGACVTFLLFAVGVMGQLFVAVLMLTNLWDYSALEAALAITPVPVMGLLVAPVVGRFADRVPPRALGIPALVAMAAGLVWFGTAPADPDYLRVLGPLVLTGAAMGAAFPAINVGAMGSVRGQELGLGSGIVNMSRQLGFALGVAVLVAVLEGHGPPTSPDDARDAFADAFRVAALFVVLAIPFALALRRKPSDATG